MEGTAAIVLRTEGLRRFSSVSLTFIWNGIGCWFISWLASYAIFAVFNASDLVMKAALWHILIGIMLLPLWFVTTVLVLLLNRRIPEFTAYRACSILALVFSLIIIRFDPAGWFVGFD